MNWAADWKTSLTRGSMKSCWGWIDCLKTLMRRTVMTVVVATMSWGCWEVVVVWVYWHWGSR